MTRARRPSFASADRRPVSGLSILAAILFALAVSIAPPAARAGVEEEDIATQIAEYRAILDEGMKRLSSLDFPEAIDAFTKVTDAYKAGKIPMVTPDARQLVAKSLEGRSLAYANQGKNSEASADFEALIRFDPGYTVNMSGVSSKIVTLYLGVRKKIVGVIVVEGEPLGSEVRLNDQSLGLTPVTDRDWLAGSYHLTIRHAGFDPYEEDLVIEAGAKLSRKFSLVPNARSVSIATVPRDVKVIVDGQERGTTFGTADVAYEGVAKEMGTSLSEISAPLLVEYLKAGRHDILLHRDCYEEISVPVTIEVDPSNNATIAYKPFILKPSRGGLKVASEPAGADVLLDGKPVGTTPAVIGEICSGRHDLLVTKEGMGRASGPVEVRNGQTLEVDRKLRLSLAVFDLRSGLHEGQDLAQDLGGLKRYNLALPGEGIPQETADRVRLELESAQGRGLSEKTLKDLFVNLQVELIGIVGNATSLGDQTEFLLYTRNQPVPDRWRFPSSGPEGIHRVAFALDAEPAVTAVWSGIKLIDVLGKPHPVVLSVSAGSPAAIAGVRPMDLLVTAAGATLQQASDLAPVMSKATPGDDIALTLETDGKLHDVKFKVLATAVVLPLKDPSILYNKTIADLRQAASMGGGTERGYASMNIGVALMHFGRYEDAIRDAFKLADLPDGSGISRGTVRYLTGIAYEKLGLAAEARTAYLDASASATATLESNDGPLLAPSARRRAEALVGQK